MASGIKRPRSSAPEWAGVPEYVAVLKQWRGDTRGAGLEDVIGPMVKEIIIAFVLPLVHLACVRPLFLSGFLDNFVVSLACVRPRAC